MIAMQGTNPRFPHHIKVTREIANSDVYPPVFTSKVILDGECRNFVSRSGGAGMTNGVIVSDFTASLPYNEISVLAGDLIEITDRVKTFKSIAVADSLNGNLGCMIWHNRTNN